MVFIIKYSLVPSGYVATAMDIPTDKARTVPLLVIEAFLWEVT